MRRGANSPNPVSIGIALAEYAEVFKTVCVDAAYYKFPDQRYLEGMVSQVLPDFLFGFKVTDEITIRNLTGLCTRR